MDFLSKCEEIRSFLKEMFNGKFYFVIVHSTSLHFHFEQKKLYLKSAPFFQSCKDRYQGLEYTLKSSLF